METIIQLYKQMSDLTQPQCQHQCRVPLSCCSGEYCEMAIEWAKEQYNVTLQETGHATLPLMGPEGCTAEPHLRPLCTLHTCAINNYGFTQDPDWDKHYFTLRDRIEAMELQKGGQADCEASPDRAVSFDQDQGASA